MTSPEPSQPRAWMHLSGKFRRRALPGRASRDRDRPRPPRRTEVPANIGPSASREQCLALQAFAPRAHTDPLAPAAECHSPVDLVHLATDQSSRLRSHVTPSEHHQAQCSGALATPQAPAPRTFTADAQPACAHPMAPVIPPRVGPYLLALLKWPKRKGSTSRSSLPDPGTKDF